MLTSLQRPVSNTTPQNKPLYSNVDIFDDGTRRGGICVYIIDARCLITVEIYGKYLPDIELLNHIIITIVLLLFLLIQTQI